MTLRTLESFSSSCGIPKSGSVVGAEGATAAAACGCAWTDEAPACAGATGAPSTSALTIRPLGPLPLSDVRPTPFCSAIRLASGEAMTRFPPVALPPPVAPAEAGASLVSLDVAASLDEVPACAGTTVYLLGSAGLADASGPGAAAAALASSPSPASSAITAPTFTPSVP